MSMGSFIYTFLPKSPENESIRRSGLDWHANVAQLSQLLCVLAIPWAKYALTILVHSLRHRRSTFGNATTREHSTSNPGQKGQGKASIMNRTASDVQSFFGREIAKGRGTYGQWFFGMSWAAWMGYLCVHDTAPDYLHLVKRFGVVGASQLPIHYLLSMNHLYGPLQLFLPKGSRRQLLPLHFVTGRLIILFVAIHAALYSGIFLQLGLFWTSVRQTKIIVALLSLAIFGAIAVSSLRSFRRKAHSVFWIIHLVGSTVILPLLYFHVRHIRLYLLECAVVVGFNAMVRIARGRSFSDS